MTHYSALHRAGWVSFTLLILFMLGSTLLMGCGFTSNDETVPDGYFDELAQQAINDSNYPQALYWLNVATTDTAWTSARHIIAGDLYYAMGRWRDAIPHWEASDTQDPIRQRQIVEIYLTLEAWDDAFELLENLLLESPNSPWLNYQLGMLLLPVNPSQALDHLLLASTTNIRATNAVVPLLVESLDDTLITMRIGLALASVGEWVHAERAFQQASQIAYPYPEALAYTAIAREQQRKDGSLWITEALTFGEAVAQVQYLYGIYLGGRQQNQASVDALTRAIVLEPNNPAYAAELGVAYQRNFQLSQAEYWLRASLTLSDNAPQYQNMLSAFYIETGFLPEDGLNVLRSAVENDPNDPDMRANYGWALYLSGNLDEAIQQLDTAISLEAQNVRALYFRGRVAYEEENFTLARDLLQQVVDIGAEFAPEAEVILEEVIYGAPPAEE